METLDIIIAAVAIVLISIGVTGFASLPLVDAYRRRREIKRLREQPGRWETVLDDDGRMIRVRWSIPDERGRYLWVRHYEANCWGLNAAEREAERFNDEHRLPSSFDSFWPLTTGH